MAKDNALKQPAEGEEPRTLVPRLKAYRLAERKADMKETLDMNCLKEMVPRAQLKKQVKMLNDMAPVLKEKEGDEEVARKLGIKKNSIPRGVSL